MTMIIPADIVMLLLKSEGTCVVEYTDYLVKSYGDPCRNCPFHISPCTNHKVYTLAVEYFTEHYPVEAYKYFVKN